MPEFSRLFPRRVHAALVAALVGAGASACGDSADLEAAAPRSVGVALTAVPTVVNVQWTTPLPAIGYVEYGPTPEMRYTTPLLDEAPGQSVNLLGLTPNTNYYYRVITWIGNDAGASKTASFTTGPLAGAIPPLNPQVSPDATIRDFVLVPLSNSGTVVIIDPQGNPVWSAVESSGLSVYRALLSLDNVSVVYNAVGPLGIPVDNSALVRVALDGSFTVPTLVPGLGLDFVEHKSGPTAGTLASLAADLRDVGGTQVRGDKIVEIVNGVPTDVWSSFDCFDPAVTPGDGSAEGWTAANALDYVDSEQAYYVSLRNFSSIVKVDRATRQCEWVVGTSGATLNFAAGSPAFTHQHQFQVYSSGGTRLLVMDNDGAGGTQSRVLEYVLDVEAGTATLDQEILPQPPAYSPVLGEPTRIAAGIYLNWSAGLLQRIDSAGQLVWQVSAPGEVFGYHHVLNKLYPKSSRVP